jgi:hypothetical protein
MRLPTSAHVCPKPAVDAGQRVGQAYDALVNSDSSRVVVIAVVIAVLGGGGFLWWRHQQGRPARAPAPPAAVQPVARPAQPVAPLPPPAPPAPEPAVRHPVAAAEGGGALPALDQADAFVKNLLLELLGRRTVQAFLVNEGLVRKFVATVDNLGRDHAPSGMWPVVPTQGRFETEAQRDGVVLARANAERYAPFVAFVAAADARRTVAVYRRLYPLFQQAYEDLGYPGKYFNDRVIDVIDDLLATPDLAQPPKVKRVEVPGASGARGPGGLFLFDDPGLESRTAGQKLLLRMGHVNAVKVKAKLGEIRKQLAVDFAAGVAGGK